MPQKGTGRRRMLLGDGVVVGPGILQLVSEILDGDGLCGGLLGGLGEEIQDSGAEAGNEKKDVLHASVLPEV